MQPIIFANHPFQAIPGHRFTHLATGGNTQSTSLPRLSEQKKDEISAVNAFPMIEQRQIF